jgi:N,N-dimethylformamidase beta subunit-like, C-terminal
VPTRLTRSSLLRAALGAGATLLLAPRTALAAVRGAPAVRSLAVRNAGRGYLGDRALLATVSPGVPGREQASISVALDQRANVLVEAVRTSLRKKTVVWSQAAELAAGEHEIAWEPEPTVAVGTYVMRVTVDDALGVRRVYGDFRPTRPDRQRAPVVRVLGVEAAPLQRSYPAGGVAKIRVLADAASIGAEILACGTEPEYTDRVDEMRGQPVTEPVVFDWRAYRGRPRTIWLRLGEWQSGVYAVRLTTDDGRLGFAPVIVRPPSLGAVRQAVVMPTNTWQAYNFADPDGDGWGDTWYAGGNPPVRLDRAYRERGTPPYWRRYDVAFLKWLRWTNRAPEFLADDDLEAFPSGDELRRLYDLVVFPGHSEYMTGHTYDVVQRFRDLGGRLIFLSANNFFWCVEKQGDVMRREKLWRAIGRPESALLGVQYRANDDGTRQGAFYVLDTDSTPWLWEGTGLTIGSRLGDMVGGYGIEIDGTTEHSPPETKVLAIVPSLFGPGLHAEMTYYETPTGARVFSAGALDFGGSATFWPVRRMLDNLWRHMTAP